MRDNMDEIPSGGVGIKLMSKIADQLSYTRTSDSRNCLFILKYYQHLSGLVPSQHSTQSGFFKRSSDVLNGLNWFQKQRNRESERSSNQPIHKISVQLKSELKAVDQVLSLIQQLEPLPIPEAVFQNCKLATIEGFTNAVRHAHKHLPLATPIDLEITVFHNRIEIKIWDCGQPFDFNAKLQEELQETSQFSLNDLEFML
ncbi:MULTISPECIES: ATP-binding protein [unclassified Microcoleus]|uniref:ATP-binding protein n=1 Tax=unclassified Microcoleus TaxID=2642155 RepID=UPI002FD1AA62